MASKYLSKEYLALNPPNKLKTAVQSLLSKVLQNTRSKILQKSLKPSKTHPEKSAYTTNRNKQTESIDKKIPIKDYLENFESKVQVSKYFSLKLIKEQKERESRKKIREEISKQKEQDEIKNNEKLLEFHRLKIEQEKEQRILKLKQSSEKRKSEIDYYKSLKFSNQPNSISVSPLYKQIERDFKHRFEMPELERRKKELLHKRELVKPVSLSEIRAHSKKIDFLLQEIRERRQHSQMSKFLDEKVYSAINNYKSKFRESVLDEDKRLKQEALWKKQEKRIMAEKKKHYAEIVGEMFHPSIDKFKQQEMKLIKARLESPVKIRNPTLSSKEFSLLKSSRSESMQPRKWKKNNMIPEPTPKRSAKRIYYLEDMRKKREKSDSVIRGLVEWHNKLEDFENEAEKIEFLRKHSKNIENAVKRFEYQIGSNIIDYDVADQMNDLIINSIKAKLANLE